MAMFQILEKNGYNLETTERDVYETMIAIAEWLRTRSKRKTR